MVAMAALAAGATEARAMAGLIQHKIRSFDGIDLAVHQFAPAAPAGSRAGARPVLLLHGLFSNAQTNWVRFGHAALLAEAGFLVVMPDLRAHGQSAAPRDPAAYPQGVLIRDCLQVAEALGLEDFDLAGFSLGARTAAGAVVAGLRPRRLVLAGMGLEGLDQWARRSAFFLDMIARLDTIGPGDPAFMAKSFMETMKIDPVSARLLLSGGVEDLAPEALGRIIMPTLVVCGEQDRDNGSPADLAAALPLGRHVAVPGTHMSSVTRAELGAAIRDFLIAP